MYGLDILCRTLSLQNVKGQNGQPWNYHSRSDHHSKVACWGIIFDLLRICSMFREHVRQQKVIFGINQRITDYTMDRKKDLDLVIATPASDTVPEAFDLRELGRGYNVQLTRAEESELASLPKLHKGQVGTVLVALEAKACMTAHQKALPRLYDELNSSHQTVHGAHDTTISAGFVMINIADRFLSPGMNKGLPFDPPHWSSHTQPKAAEITLEKIRKLPRRAKIGTAGYDALASVVVDCVNDGSPVTLHAASPSPQPGDLLHYDSMIDRLCSTYSYQHRHL